MADWQESILYSITVRLFNLKQEVSLEDPVSFREQINYVGNLSRILSDKLPGEIREVLPYMLTVLNATTEHGSQLLSNPTREAFKLWVIFATHVLQGMAIVLSLLGQDTG